MNIHSYEDDDLDNNAVSIKSRRTCYTNIMTMCEKYNFTKDEINNYVTSIDNLLPNQIEYNKGIITRIFKHTRGHILFMVRLTTGPYIYKYIVVGRTGIKKEGKINIKLTDIRRTK